MEAFEAKLAKEQAAGFKARVADRFRDEVAT